MRDAASVGSVFVRCRSYIMSCLQHTAWTFSSHLFSLPPVSRLSVSHASRMCSSFIQVIAAQRRCCFFQFPISSRWSVLSVCVSLSVQRLVQETLLNCANMSWTARLNWPPKCVSRPAFVSLIVRGIATSKLVFLRFDSLFLPSQRHISIKGVVCCTDGNFVICSL